MQNHFELFQLPQQFAIDMAALEKAYLSVQGQTHPDRFVQATDAEKRVAMQWATRANEAFQTLKNPLKRAAYLCELHGADVAADTNTAMAPAFLMQQMEWREALEDAKAARDVAQLEALDDALGKVRKATIAQLGQLLDAQQFGQATAEVRKLMFLDKFGEEIGNAFAMLDD